MRRYLIRQLRCDTCARRRMKEIRQLVFKKVRIIIDYRVPIDLRTQLKPRLNFIATNIVSFIKYWCHVETGQHMPINFSTKVVNLTPRR
jgi:hypothetical protein